MKVLVVHRQEAVVASIKAQMSQWSIRSAFTGLDGLWACRTESFDLILCGLDLPVITGIEMVRSIRIISTNQKTPVILLAEGNETPEHARLIAQMHANLLTFREVQEMEELHLESWL
jgi:CheY-like chemotaxis protein